MGFRFWALEQLLILFEMSGSFRGETEMVRFRIMIIIVIHRDRRVQVNHLITFKSGRGEAASSILKRKQVVKRSKSRGSRSKRAEGRECGY